MAKHNKTLHIGGMLITLTALWLLLSGHYTPLLLALGAVSILLVTLITVRMRLLNYEAPEVFGQTVLSLPYGFWLLKEIIKSNIDVMKRILDPALPVSPQVVNIKSTQKHDLPRVAYANSITLTPGTISVDVEHDYIEVHALAQSGVDGLATGEMDSRISDVEAKGDA